MVMFKCTNVVEKTESTKNTKIERHRNIDFMLETPFTIDSCRKKCLNLFWSRMIDVNCNCL